MFVLYIFNIEYNELIATFSDIWFEAAIGDVCNVACGRST